MLCGEIAFEINNYYIICMNILIYNFHLIYLEALWFYMIHNICCDVIVSTLYIIYTIS